MKEVRDQVDGIWEIDDLIHEMYSLSNNFMDYKHGFVQVPNTARQRNILNQMNKNCTFKPKINKIS